MKANLDAAGVVEQEAALRQAAKQAFYNTSRFTLNDLRARASRQQLTGDFQGRYSARAGNADEDGADRECHDPVRDGYGCDRWTTPLFQFDHLEAPAFLFRDANDDHLWAIRYSF